MKNMRKLLALALAVMMVLSLATTAFAQTVGTATEGTGSITIFNAAKGETYGWVKLFDASVTGNENGSIAYTGDIPEELVEVFEKDTAGNISVKADKSEKEVTDAVQAWAKKQTAQDQTVSDGTALTFAGLKYGYYAIISSQGSVVTIDSTNPNATIIDKNTTTVKVTKKVNDTDVDIGQTVTYTLTTNTANWITNSKGVSEIVTEYVIMDTLPAFLSEVTVTGIVIDQPKGDDITLTVQQFNADKKITIAWAEQDAASEKYSSLYENGSQIIITYTAKVTKEAVIDGTGNKNEITVIPNTTPNDGTPPDEWEESWKDDEVIYTYAAALQKVDENKKPLAGAKFAAKGLTVEKVSNGVYKVVSYDPESDEYGTEMETDSEGQLVILGLSSESVLTVQETAAPAGYNKLVETTTMTPVKTGEEIKATSTTIYYDANGKVTDQVTNTYYEKTTYNVNLLKTAVVVINNAGTELPSTGGMGTTLFYVFGGILVLAAVVLLVTKKRMTMAE